MRQFNVSSRHCNNYIKNPISFHFRKRNFHFVVLFLLFIHSSLNNLNAQECLPGWEQNTFSWTDINNAYQYGGTATATATYSSPPVNGDFEVEGLEENGVNPGMWGGSATFAPAFNDLPPNEGGYLAYLTSGDNTPGQVSSRIITYTISEELNNPLFYIGSTGVEPWTTLDFSGTVGLTSITILDDTKLVTTGPGGLTLMNNTLTEDQPQGQGVVRLNGSFDEIVINIVNRGPDASMGEDGEPADRFRFGFGSCVQPAVPDISTVKTITNTMPSAVAGATDITFEITFVNTGNIFLDNIQLEDNMQAQIGCAFNSISTPPTITASTATTNPTLNGGFNGAGNPNIFNGSTGLMKIGESITVQFTAAITPCGEAPNPLTNQATASGRGVDAGGNPTGGNVSDPSDSGTDPTGDNPSDPGDTGGTDDPVPFTVIMPEISVTKVLAATAPPASGTSGNANATFTLVVQNTGDTQLRNIDLQDNLASQFGSAFVATVGMPSITGGSATTLPMVNTNYNGDTNTGIFDGSSGVLNENQTVIVNITVEIDPNAPSAPMPLINQADVSADATENDGTALGIVVTDDSDSGTDPESTNPTDPGDMGTPDDPTPVPVPVINLTKELAGAAIAASGAPGNVDATFTLIMENTGNVILNNLDLIDMLSVELGNAFVAVSTAPSITASTATTNPIINGGFNGVANSNMFTGISGTLAPGQTITVSVGVELDPNAAGAANPLLNQATAVGDAANPDGTPINDPTGNPLTTTDDSDSGDDPESTNPTAPGDMGTPDDPTPVTAPSINLAKQVLGIAPAASNIAGNADVTFQLIVENTGNVNLDNLTLIDNLMTELGAAFVSVTTAPAISASTATTNPSLADAYNGGSSAAIFLGTDGLLEPGQTITVTLTAEVNADAPGASNPLLNQGMTTGRGLDPDTGNPITSPTGDPFIVSDDSDSGEEPESVNPNEPGDTGGSDDPTPFQVPSINVAKQIVDIVLPAASNIAGNADLTYELEIENTGNTNLNNITLTEMIAAQYGDAFVAIITAPSITGGTATSNPTLDTGFDGVANSDIFIGTDGLLEPGQTILIQFTAEVDPNAAPSPLLNQVQTSGIGVNPDGTPITDPSGVPFVTTDDSDTGSDPQTQNPGEDGDTGGSDDPTVARIPIINVAKYVSGLSVAASGTPGNADVQFTLVVENTGNVILNTITLEDDIAAQFNGAFVGITTAPAIAASTATMTPSLNGGYNGSNAIFTGTDGVLEPGQTIEVTVTIEVDANGAGAPDPLTNQVTTSGIGVDELGNPIVDENGIPLPPVTDDSDSGPEPESQNPGQDGDTGGSDDPTPVYIPIINTTKTLAKVQPSQNEGNVYAHFNLVIENTGNVALTNIQLTDDLATQLGSTFVGVAFFGKPEIIASSATENPVTNAQGFNGQTDFNIFDGTSGNIEPGQSVTINIVVEMDPNADGAPSPLLNQTTATANGINPESGELIADPMTGTPYVTTDLSDDGTEPETDNPDEPGDMGTSDDPTPLDARLPEISLAKALINTAPATTPGNQLFTFELIMKNTGNTDLQDIKLRDKLAQQFGTAWVQTIGNPSITASTAQQTPSLNPSFDGAGDFEIFVGTDGYMTPGQTVTVRFTVELTPGAVNAPDPLLNSARVIALPIGADGNPLIDPSVGVPIEISDVSDSGDTPESNNPMAPNDCSDSLRSTDTPCNRNPTPLNSVPLLCAIPQDETVDPYGVGMGPLMDWLATNGNSAIKTPPGCGEGTWTNDYSIDNFVNTCSIWNGCVDVNFTYSDDCGFTFTFPATFCFEDKTGPTCAYPIDFELDCEEGDFEQAIANFANNYDPTDQSQPVTTTVDYDASLLVASCGNSEGVTVTFTFTDACGNATVRTSQVFINDNTAPVLLTPAIDMSSECDDNATTTFNSWLANRGGATASDACGNVSWTTNPATPILSDGSATVTFIATDDCGNAVETTASFMDNGDNIAPVFTTQASNISANCGDNAQAMFNAWIANNAGAIASDNGALTITTNPANPALGNGATSVSFIATDACGNTATTSATFTNNGDNTAPVFTTQASNMTANCSDNAQAMFNAWIANNAGAIASDNNTGLTITSNPANPTLNTACNGTTSVTYTATDACGNTATTSATFTNNTDSTNPVLSGVPANVTVTCATIPAAANVTASDNCTANVSFNESQSGNDCTVGYTITRTWTATDGCGNTVNGTQIITVSADQPMGDLTVVPPTDLDLDCTQTIPAPALEVSTTCTTGGAAWTVTEVTNAGSCPNSYTITRTYTATDNCGNSQTVNQTVSVSDTTPPIFTVVPANADVNCEAYPGGFGTPLTADDCSEVTLTFVDDLEPYICDADFNITRTWTATDACGNVATASQTLTVWPDVEAPIFSFVPGDDVIQCPATPQFGEPIISDDCTGFTVTSVDETIVEGDCPQGYTVRRTWTAIDGCGNAETQSQTITVIQAPAGITLEFVEVPADKTVSCGSTDNEFGEPLCFSNCDDGFTLTFIDTEIVGSCPNETIATRVWTAIDACGNTAQCAQTVTTVDNTAPTFGETAGDKTITCGQAMNFTTPASTDLCGNVSVTFADVTEYGTCPGTTHSVTRTWTATDDCGNAAEAQQTIYVEEDAEAPVVSTFEQTLYASCGVEIAFANPTFTDNCSEVTMTYTDEIVGDACDLMKTRTWTASDACGNVTEAQQTVIYTDETAPIFENAPVEITLTSTEFANWAVPTLSAIDECGTATTQLALEGFENGKYIYTFVATDNCGNQTFHNLTVKLKGASSIFETSIAVTNGTETIKVYPNPTKGGNLNVIFSLNTENTASAQVMDMTGRIVETIKVDAVRGLNNLSIDTDKLVAGTYYIHVAAGDTNLVERFVKLERK